jgi:tRNA threonylcarbamoyl adenosine modification protein YeaZ
MNKQRYTLVLDTATRHPTLALSTREADLVGERQWESRHRHGEQLLEELDQLLGAVNARARDLDGIISGVGPGSFTGLRIGMATAKTIAYSVDVPIVGISTTEALALAAGDGADGRSDFAVTLPAGASDRYLHHVAVDGGEIADSEAPQLAVPGTGFDEAVGNALLVALDLDGAEDVSDAAVVRGETALRGLGRALAKLGLEALERGRVEDVARLVPAYVALPRGIAQAAAEMTWSPDLR